jgi:translocation and assembly module TamA
VITLGRSQMARCSSRTLGVLLACAAAAATGCATVRGTAEEPAVVDLRLEGVRRFDKKDIIEKLATQESDRPAHIPIAGPLLYQARAVLGGVENRPLDPDQLAVDRRRVEAFYRERGYYDAKVTEVDVVPAGRGRVNVVMRVEEGAPVRVSSVEIAGIDAAPEARAKLGELPLREGDVFTVSAYDAAKGRIVRALRNTGWANAEVKQEAQVLPEEKRAEVRYTVDAGPRFKFGPIFVAGTRTVPRDRVREQAGIEVVPGEWYQEEKLAGAQKRVFDLGVFGGVRVTRGTPDLQRGIIPIVVAVREAPFRTVRLGPSVGVQGATSWDVSGTAGWTHRNFFGDLRKLDLSLRAGYAGLLVGEPKQGPVALAAVEFSQPGAISRRIDASVRLELERGLEQGYDFWSERLRVGFPIRIAPRWTLVPSYNLEVYQLTNVVSFDSTQPSDEGPELQSCVNNVCLLSYLEQQLAWDGRDDPVNTRRGLYVALSVQEGANLGRYGYRYFRFLPEARGFVPLGDRFVLAARARIGMLSPVGEQQAPPIVARFYAGGPQSMRGYGTNRLSPMVLQNGDWIPVGGNGLVDGSLELRFDIAGPLGGAVFADAGYVSRPSSSSSAFRDALDPTLLQWALGLGVRYRTPFGPIRLDVAFRLPTDLSSGVPFPERFPAVPSVDSAGNVVGEHREPWWAFHLSIGEAF